eukprot:TRINITY_DN1645_c0_g1_i1.p2 TRINITY_DN1645_c0_g1~~TRINITY_DN1645_c0_g1_i1.p2  ORF type:complete len:221 (+),score=9.55 TRINITY_DN1645_c0_g1_i1:3-665(+)
MIHSLFTCQRTSCINCFLFFFFLMIRRPPRSTHCISSAASDVYKRQGINAEYMGPVSAENIEIIFWKFAGGKQDGCIYLLKRSNLWRSPDRDYLDIIKSELRNGFLVYISSNEICSKPPRQGQYKLLSATNCPDIIVKYRNAHFFALKLIHRVSFNLFRNVRPFQITDTCGASFSFQQCVNAFLQQKLGLEPENTIRLCYIRPGIFHIIFNWIGCILRLN